MRHIPLAAILLVAASHANAADYDKDMAGASDHPMLKRYEGSSLYMTGGENLGQAKIVAPGQGKLTIDT